MQYFCLLHLLSQRVFTRHLPYGYSLLFLLIPPGLFRLPPPLFLSTPLAHSASLPPPPLPLPFSLSPGLGDDLRDLLTSTSAQILSKAAAASDVSINNPIVLQLSCERVPARLAATPGTDEPGPFFINAILSRPDGDPGFLIIDFEPIKEQMISSGRNDRLSKVSEDRASASDTPRMGEGGHQAMYQQQALRASAQLQKLPPGDMARVCHVAAREVRKLTGYDRVMVYRFHADEHGEVVAEDRRGDWEPYLGLHYPATDVPRAARFVFLKTGKRAIFDSAETPVSPAMLLLLFEAPKKLIDHCTCLLSSVYSWGIKST